MSDNQLQYGAINNTWFLYRPCNNPRHLYISPVIVYDHLQPTLFKCFLYLVSLSHLNRECPILLSSEDSSPHDDVASFVDDGTDDNLPHDDVDGDPSFDDT